MTSDLIDLTRPNLGNQAKTLAKVRYWAFDLGMNEVRLIPVALIAIGLLSAGCESLRPPPQEQAVRDVEQQPSQPAHHSEAEDWLYWIAYDVGSVFVH